MRDTSRFQDYVAQAIKENFYDMYELVEEETEHYDHKRGFTNLRTELKVKAGDLRNMKSKEMFYRSIKSDHIFNWRTGLLELV